MVRRPWGTTAESVAEDITQRLLADYKSEYAKQKAKVGEYDVAYSEQLKVIRSLADLVGVEPNKQRQINEHGMTITVKLIPPSVNVHVLLESMSLVCAEAVLRAYIENQPRLTNEERLDLISAELKAEW